MMNSLGRYKILVTDSSGSTIADISSMAQKLHFRRVRNRASFIDLQLDLDDCIRLSANIGVAVSTIFETNRNEIHIYRDGTQIVAGQINWYNPRAAVTRSIGLQAVGWLDLFAKRFLTVATSYTSTDIGAIMWDLINDSQNLTDGGFGITQGTIETSRTADRNYEIYKSVRDAIIQLSEVENSPDFEITPAKVLNVYYPNQGSRLTDVSLTYPGNILDLELTRDGNKMANQVIANGAGTGADRLLSVQTDTALRSYYKLRQEVVQFPDVALQATLDEHAEEELRASKTYFDIPVVTVAGDSPDLNDYGLGDEIEIKVAKDLEVFDTVNGFFRIDAIDVNIDQNEQETVQIKLGLLG